MALVMVTVVTYFNLPATLLGGTVVIGGEEMRKGRHREVRALAQVTQLIHESGGSNLAARLPHSACPYNVVLPLQGRGCHHCHHFGDKDTEIQRV